VEELAQLEATKAQGRPGGALAAVGALAEFEEREGIIGVVIRSRAQRRDREMEFE
jgi:hypothetical protein